MIFGLKGIEFEDRILGNSDEKVHFDLVGEKIVPILVYNGGKYMVESLDIVKYIDTFDSNSVLDEYRNPELNDWMNVASVVIYPLTMPRFVKMNLEEFSTQEDIDYYTKKKENMVGNFDQLINEKTDELIVSMEEFLGELEEIISSSEFATGESLSYDDICLFLILRNLTCVKGLTFSGKVKEYIHNMAEKSKINLYFDNQV